MLRIWESFFRVKADGRDLNYDSYTESGDKRLVVDLEYNSGNTSILTVEEIKQKLMEVEYVRIELDKWRSET